MQEDDSEYFWPSYVDLLTTIIFVLLGYLVYSNFNLQKAEDTINSAKGLDESKTLFIYNEEIKRYELAIDINFDPAKSDIEDVFKNNPNSEYQLRDAANKIQVFFEKLSSNKMYQDVNYIMVIEGQAQRYDDKKGFKNWESNPDIGYILSYERALSIVNWWKNEGYNFTINNEYYSKTENKNFELLISGAGYFSKSRKKGSGKNLRFTIQIMPILDLN